MRYRNQITCLLLIFLLSCNSAPQSNQTVPASTPLDSPKAKAGAEAKAIAFDDTLYRNYQHDYDTNSDSISHDFLGKELAIMRQFKGRNLDTTILTIGNIDGDHIMDTILTHVYYDKDSVHVDSKWINNNQTLWSDRFTNPYLDVPGIDYNNQKTWLVFGIGVIYGPPQFEPRFGLEDPTDSTSMNTFWGQGLDDLRKAGIHTSAKAYLDYVRSFDSQLLAFGDPESREGVWIWYKPLHRFITFFQP